MRKLMLIFSLCVLGFLTVSAQDLINNTKLRRPTPAAQQEPNFMARHIEDRARINPSFRKLKLLEYRPLNQRNDYTDYVSQAVFLDLDRHGLQEFLHHPDRDIQLAVPVTGNRQLSLELTQVDIVADNFTVTTASGSNTLYEPTGLFYRGIVSGDPASVVVASFFHDEIRILISDQDGVYVLGKLADQENRYIFFCENYLQQQPDWSCQTPDTPLPRSGKPGNKLKLQSKTAVEDKCVKIYVETEFQIYQLRSSSLLSVVDYVFGLFNESFVAYAGIGIKMEISQIFVWDQADPYSDDMSENSTGGVLSSFVSNRPTFNGDLAHLLTTRDINGGKANGIGGICENEDDLSPHCVSGNLSSVNPGVLPTTSFTLFVIAHEMGHVLGSFHTHACRWGPGGNEQIDDCGNIWATTDGTDNDDDCPGDTNMDGVECGPGDTNVDEADEAEGSSCFDNTNPLDPPTANGWGTIMSYCHLTTRLDMANGFAAGPTDLIVSTVMDADCLSEECSCEEFTDRTVNGAPIPSAVYTASNSVTSTGDANGPAANVVIFRAGNFVALQPGFEATELFLAEIVSTLCASTGSDALAPLPANLEVTEMAAPREQGLQLFPNPATDHLNIAYVLPEDGAFSIQLINPYGQVLRIVETAAWQKEGHYQQSIKVDRLPAGMYYIWLETSAGAAVMPFTVGNN